MLTETPTANKLRTAAECVIAVMREEALRHWRHHRQDGALKLRDGSPAPGFSTTLLRDDMSVAVACWGDGSYAFTLRKNGATVPVGEDEAVQLVAASFETAVPS